MSILDRILGGAAAPVVGYFQRRMELKAEDRRQERELKAAVHERQMALVRDGLAADATWELESLKAHAGGWKDEFVLLVLSAPFIAGFHPAAQPYIERGWEMLAKAPWWYPVALLSVFLATYGIRWFRRMQYDTP